MARIIDSSNESTIVGQRFSFKADIDFLQQEMRDISASIIESIISDNYDNTKTYILKGCKVTSVGGNTTIGSGFIFGIVKSFGGLPPLTYIYYHPGSTFADPSGGNVIIGSINSTSSTFDPTPFTDGNSRNVHNIIQILFSVGASNSGDVNYSDLILLNTSYRQDVYVLGIPSAFPTIPSTFFGVKKSNDQIIISGNLGCTVTSNVFPKTLTFITLNNGFKPLEDIQYPTWVIRTVFGGGITAAIEIITISTSGDLTLVDTVGNNEITILMTGVNFRCS